MLNTALTVHSLDKGATFGVVLSPNECWSQKRSVENPHSQLKLTSHFEPQGKHTNAKSHFIYILNITWLGQWDVCCSQTRSVENPHSQLKLMGNFEPKGKHLNAIPHFIYILNITWLVLWDVCCSQTRSVENPYSQLKLTGNFELNSSLYIHSQYNLVTAMGL